MYMALVVSILYETVLFGQVVEAMYLNTDFVRVELTSQEIGFSYVNCTGNERGLENCTVGNLTSHTCSQAGIAQCYNGSYIITLL